MSDEHEPRRAFPAQSMDSYTAEQLNRWSAEDVMFGSAEWPLPISGDATTWAADGDRAAWAAMAT